MYNVAFMQCHTVNKQISAVVKVCFFHLRLLSKIRPHLS